MNDNASLAVSSPRSGLGGLPQRLVQDGVVEESAMLEALHAARERKSSVVTQLVANGAAKARDIAIAASNEFGVPLFDLDAVNLDLETVRLVSDKLLAKHRVLPIFKRGKRLFLAVADPTNLHAIDEIKFQTGLGVEAIVVEDDKLQRALDKAIEQVDAQMPSLGDDEGVDLESLEVTGGDDELDDKITRDDVEDAPIVRFVNKLMLDAIRRGASDIHFEPYETRHEALRATQSNVAPRYCGASHSSGRPHQDEAV
jgi:type IV pilus assembly protein PilB